tara:strand:- start:5139 stop:5537 length:399 start_codon:yes stop_codon:yes gene_type:complete
MALQSSGQISLNDIRVELGAATTNVSLGTMSDTAGFSAQDQISDFYGYSHSACTSFASSVFSRSFSFTACSDSTSSTRWHNGSGTWVESGDTVYANSGCTTAQNDGYYKQADDTSYRITGGSGLCTSITICS